MISERYLYFLCKGMLVDRYCLSISERVAAAEMSRTTAGIFAQIVHWLMMICTGCFSQAKREIKQLIWNISVFEKR